MLNNFLLKQNLVKQNGTTNEPSLKSPNLQGFRLTPNSEEVMLFQTYALNSVQGVGTRCMIETNVMSMLG